MTTLDHNFVTTLVVMAAHGDLKTSKMDSLTLKTPIIMYNIYVYIQAIHSFVNFWRFWPTVEWREGGNLPAGIYIQPCTKAPVV